MINQVNIQELTRRLYIGTVRCFFDSIKQVKNTIISLLYVVILGSTLPVIGFANSNLLQPTISTLESAQDEYNQLVAHIRNKQEEVSNIEESLRSLAYTIENFQDNTLLEVESRHQELLGIIEVFNVAFNQLLSKVEEYESIITSFEDGTHPIAQEIEWLVDEFNDYVNVVSQEMDREYNDFNNEIANFELWQEEKISYLRNLESRLNSIGENYNQVLANMEAEIDNYNYLVGVYNNCTTYECQSNLEDDLNRYEVLIANYEYDLEVLNRNYHEAEQQFNINYQDYQAEVALWEEVLQRDQQEITDLEAYWEEHLNDENVKVDEEILLLQQSFENDVGYYENEIDGLNHALVIQYGEDYQSLMATLQNWAFNTIFNSEFISPICGYQYTNVGVEICEMTTYISNELSAYHSLQAQYDAINSLYQTATSELEQLSTQLEQKRTEVEAIAAEIEANMRHIDPNEVKEMRFSTAEIELLLEIDGIQKATRATQTLLTSAPFTSAIPGLGVPLPTSTTVEVAGKLAETVIFLGVTDLNAIYESLNAVGKIESCAIKREIEEFKYVDEHSYSSNATEYFFERILQRTELLCSND